MPGSDASPYAALLERFRSTGMPFRELDHPPAAAASEYHDIVGSRLAQQAKALLLRRHRADGAKAHVIHALPGDRRADLGRLGTAAIRQLRLATEAELRSVTGCRFGELPRSVGVRPRVDSRRAASRRT